MPKVPNSPGKTQVKNTKIQVILGIPLYPILAALLLALFFLTIRLLALATVVIGPVALVAFAWWQLLEAQDRFISLQQLGGKECPLGNEHGI